MAHAASESKLEAAVREQGSQGDAEMQAMRAQLKQGEQASDLGAGRHSSCTPDVAARRFCGSGVNGVHSCVTPPPRGMQRGAVLRC